MNLNSITLNIVFVSFFAQPVSLLAQERYAHCDSLLRHGIDESIRRTSSNKVEAYLWQKHCQSDLDSRTDTHVLAIDFEMFGYLGAESDGNSTFARQRISKWCSEKESSYSNRSSDFLEIRALNGPALNAWNQCQEFAKKDLRFESKIQGTPAERVLVTIDSDSDGDFRLLGVNSNNFGCQVFRRREEEEAYQNLSESLVNKNDASYLSLPEDSGELIIRNDNIQVVCDRMPPSNDVVEGVGKIKYEFSSIDILTDADAFSLSFDRVIDTYYVTPPGSIVAFNSDRCPAGWNPYEAAYGRFIRGIDKSGTGIDPEGEREPGSPQEDQFQTHQHSLTYWGSHTVGARPHWNMEYPTEDGNRTLTTTTVTSGRHGSETRPKNVSLLYCTRSNQSGTMQVNNNAEQVESASEEQ